jgi:hypothetical protein
MSFWMAQAAVKSTCAADIPSTALPHLLWSFPKGICIPRVRQHSIL